MVFDRFELVDIKCPRCLKSFSKCFFILPVYVMVCPLCKKDSNIDNWFVVSAGCMLNKYLYKGEKK